MDFRPAIVALAVTACQSPGAVRVETVEILKPVPVYCVTPDQIPADPPSVNHRLTGNAAQDIGPVMVAALEWKRIATKMRALLAGCVEP